MEEGADIRRVKNEQLRSHFLVFASDPFCHPTARVINDSASFFPGKKLSGESAFVYFSDGLAFFAVPVYSFCSRNLRRLFI